MRARKHQQILARASENVRLANPPKQHEFLAQPGCAGLSKLLIDRSSSKGIWPPDYDHWLAFFPRRTETSIVSAGLNKPNEAQRTILVVDDFDDTRLLLRTWLQKRGFRVVEAENGNSAVAAAERIRPDLIIMDVEMPELDGLAATRKIRELKNLASVPIVAVSAYGADQYRDHALAAGCNEYVSTPFEPDELERLIRSLIE